MWPETINTVSAVKNKFILKLLEKIEIGLYKDRNKVIAVTKSFKNNLIMRGINQDKIEVITNGIIKFLSKRFKFIISKKLKKF